MGQTKQIVYAFKCLCTDFVGWFGLAGLTNKQSINQTWGESNRNGFKIKEIKILKLKFLKYQKTSKSHPKTLWGSKRNDIYISLSKKNNIFLKLKIKC